MLTDFIRAAMERAEYARLDDGSYFGEIPGIQGVWANGRSQDDTRGELQEVLEGWIVLRLEHRLPIPDINGITLKITQVA